MNFKWLIGILCLNTTGWAASVQVRCERERYYAGDSATCQIELPSCVADSYKGTWSLEWVLLGQSLKKESRTLRGGHPVEQFTYDLPATISTLATIDVTAREMVGKAGSFCGISGDISMGSVGPVLRGRTRIDVYPAASTFYLKPETLRGKRIAINDASGKLKKELEFLKLPYDSVQLTDMPAKRYDLFILGRSSSTPVDLVPANVAPVIQMDVDTHLDPDPLTRWLLAERIRAVFKIQKDAKDLRTSRSNP